MKILITGGAGYIGAVLVPRLLEEKHDVTVVDNFMYNQIALLDCCHYKGLKIIRADAREPQVIKEAMKKTDAVFPLACLTGAPICDKKPQEAEAIIIGGLKEILKNRSKDQMIIYPTTNSGYGVGEKNKFCTEETPLRPISLYGRLKVQAESVVLESKNAITLRLATAFGISPRMRLDLLVNDFTYRALTVRHIELFEAHFKRNFIHVRDIAGAFIHCLKKFTKMKNETYNVGLSNANLSKRELCEAIQKYVPGFTFSESHAGKDPDQRDYIVSNAKIEATGFRQEVSLTDGIQELVKGFQVINAQKSVCQLTNV